MAIRSRPSNTKTRSFRCKPRFQYLESIGWSSFSKNMAVASLASSFPFSHLSLTRSFFFHSSKPSTSSLSLYSFSASRTIHQRIPKLPEILGKRPPPHRRVSGINSSAVESAQEIVPAADDVSGYSIISALLLIAFIGLSVLTIGVIYLAVQDFLQKREREKFEEEEAEKKKKDRKKKKMVRARAGPRGFGQKIDEEDDN